MSANAQPRLTPEQYLEIERAAEFKSEYYNGHMYAMAGGSPKHAWIIGNLTGLLHSALRKRPCRVSPSELRLQALPGGLLTYPDVIVTCGDPQYSDDRQDTLVNPTFLAEVLSPSTESYDRGFKASQYRLIESLEEHALISQAEPRVQIFRRQPEGGWLLSEFAGLDAVCRFHSLNCEIALADLYEKIEFEENLPLRETP